MEGKSLDHHRRQVKPHEFSRASLQIPKILRELGSFLKKQKERAHQLEATPASPTPQPR